jgi:hypothetical protein
MFEKGQKTFTASSSVANSFMWLLDGDTLNETTNTFSRDWVKGNYLLTAFPFIDGCIGDSFSAQLIVKDDVTIDGGQASFETDTTEVCALSDAGQTSALIEIPFDFTGYTLLTGESYSIKYIIDDEIVVTTPPYKVTKAVLSINTLGLSQGFHKLKITRLMYGAGFKNQVDYTTSKHIPTMVISVKTMPEIGEINF